MRWQPLYEEGKFPTFRCSKWRRQFRVGLLFSTVLNMIPVRKAKRLEDALPSRLGYNLKKKGSIHVKFSTIYIVQWKCTLKSRFSREIFRCEWWSHLELIKVAIKIIRGGYSYQLLSKMIFSITWTQWFRNRILWKCIFIG